MRPYSSRQHIQTPYADACQAVIDGVFERKLRIQGRHSNTAETCRVRGGTPLLLAVEGSAKHTEHEVWIAK
jgi:hypothetical protein